MSLLIRDSAGDTLGGAIDGTNVVYTTSQPMDSSYLAVYVNGRLKIADLDDGYSVVDTTHVQMHEALLPGDTLEVEYRLGAGGTAGGGGALGGIPDAPLAEPIAPSVILTDDIKPSIL